MIIYNRYDGFSIWVNSVLKTFHIQNDGEAIQEVGYSTSEEAINIAKT